jgi:hypothetical protein
LSREQWCALGRVVDVENSEAKDVVSFWEKKVRGARHVFSEEQTNELEQFQRLNHWLAVS